MGERRAGHQQLDAARGDDQHEQLDHLAANTRYTIRMEFYEQTGDAVARLQWRLPNNSSYVTIPREALFGN